jgi:two-component system response regulator HydG
MALAHADEALALAERIADRYEIGRALAARASALVRADDLRAAWAATRRARRHLAGRGPAVDYVRALMMSAYQALKLGRPREAERHARRAIRLAAGEAHAQIRLGAHTNLGFALIRQGRPEAAAVIEAALEEGTRRGLPEIIVVGRYLLGLDAVERGAVARALRATADPLPPGGFHIECLRVDVECLFFRPDRARAAAAALTGDSAFTRAKALVRAAMAELAAGRAPAALERLERARATGGHGQDHFLAIELALCEAEALLEAGRRDRAEERLLAAGKLVAPAEMPGYHARVIVLRERLGARGHGAAGPAERRAELGALLDRLASLGLERDAAAVATVLAARSADAAGAAAARARAEAAVAAMAAGLEGPLAAELRAALARRLENLARSLPEERPLELPAPAAARLLAVYAALARESDPEALLPRVLDAAAGLAGAARAFLLLREGARLRVAAGRGEGIAIDARRGGPSRTIAEEALRTGRPVRIEGARSDARFALTQSVACVGLGGVLAVPLAGGLGPAPGETGGRGVIYLDDGGAGRAFTAEDEALLVAFADQAALALAAADALRAERHRRETIERRLAAVRRDLERTAADLRSIRSALSGDLDRIEARFEGMIGRAPAMRRVFDLVERAAPRAVPVLITGETGTGKELTARALHARSPRRERPFVAVNCGAIPPSLLESELFGHEAGAFTGATARRAGLFEQGNGGTVFLDEIGEMPPAMQAAFLRVLETGELRRVGGRETIRTDVRVIAATHRDLRAMVAAGRFREDLYFRLNVLAIELPPLRARLEDLPLLAESIIAELAGAAGTEAPRLTPRALRRLLAHPFPGNIRELRNVLARAVILSSNRAEIGEDAIDLDAAGAAARPARAVGGPAPAAPPLEIIDFQVAKDRWIKAFLEAALERAGGNVTRAAELTGMKRQAFGRLLANHGISRSARPSSST